MLDFIKIKLPGLGKWTDKLQQDGKRELAGCYNYANRDPFQELAPEVYKDKWYEW